MTSNSSGSNEGLVRAIGTWALGLSVVNLVVGAGIFALPGRIAAELGSAAIIAYLVCSVVVSLVFLCFAEVGSRVHRSGGAYAYIEEAFGRSAGLVASILFWFGFSAMADAGITVVMVESIATVAPFLNEPIPRAFFIVAVVAFLATVNVVGVRAGVRLYVFNTWAKLVPLLLLLIAGVFVIDIDKLVIGQWPSAEAVGAATILLFFAFTGAESALSASGEIKNPSRTVPMGLMFGICALLLLYLGLQTVSQGVLGAELASNTEAPLVAVAEAVFGPWGGKMLLVGMVLSIYGALSGDMLGGPRVVFASSLDGNLPKFLSSVHPRYKTPYVAIVFFALIVCVLALTGTFRYLVVVATGSLLLIYLGVSLAVLRLRQRDGLPEAGQFRLPFGPLIPVLSCGIVGWLLLQMPPEEAKGLAVLVSVALAFCAVRALLRRSSPTLESREP